MELFLITGFLGAGKTTLIKNIVKSLGDKRLFLIINEFGKEGVDATLLRELDAAITEIDNGSIFCTCRLDKFEDTLSCAVSQGPEIILVEASGLSDPTNVRRILAQDKYSAINYRGSICLIDPLRFEKVLNTARMVKRQLAISSLVIVNKTDIATPEQIEKVTRLVREINPQAEIICTAYAKVDRQIILGIKQKDYDFEAGEARDITLQKYLITVSEEMTVKQLEGFLNMIADETYRIKGFVRLAGILFFVDCVGPFVNYYEYHDPQVAEVNKIVVLAGPGMSTRKIIKEARQWYEDVILKVE